MKKLISSAVFTLSFLALSSSAQASWLSEAAKDVGLPLPSLPPVLDIGTPIESSPSCLSVVTNPLKATLVNNTGGKINYSWRQGNKNWANLVLENGYQQPLEGGFGGGCGSAQAIGISFENGNGVYREYVIGTESGQSYNFKWENGSLDLYQAN